MQRLLAQYRVPRCVARRAARVVEPTEHLKDGRGDGGAAAAVVVVRGCEAVTLLQVERIASPDGGDRLLMITSVLRTAARTAAAAHATRALAAATACEANRPGGRIEGERAAVHVDKREEGVVRLRVQLCDRRIERAQVSAPRPVNTHSPCD